ncbi:MAG TPA: hypothetical protein VKE93_10860 [Candidatus Angelobacter sp.]|nr:hypothetical protein [Candidatus Angelobacter sp.]
MHNLVSVFERKLVVAVCGMTLLGGWHVAKAQVVKGAEPVKSKLTAAQIHEHLRATQGQGRTSARISNPHAAQLDNSAIIVVCRNQKQNADREAQDIIPTLNAMGDGSRKAGITDGTSKAAQKTDPQQLTITGKQPSNAQGLTITGNQPAGNQGAQQLTITGKQPSNAQGLTISGTQPAANKTAAPAGAATGNSTAGGAGGKTGGPSGNSPAVMNANTKTAAGDMGGPQIHAPQQPMKTESSSVAQTAGTASSATVVTGPCPTPTIKSISGFPMAIFTPGPLFGPYTIKGCGFGWQMGNVYLTGAFNAGKIPLQVQMTGGGGAKKAPARASWTDTLIIVTVDPNLTGEIDQSNVTLVVEPVSGPPITKPGNDFMALRETVELATIPQAKVQFTQLGPVSKGASPTTAPSATLGPNPPGFDLLYFTPSNIPTGMSAEVFRGGTTVFFPDGYDYYDLHPLATGFFVESFQLHYDPDPTNCDADTAGARGSWSATFDSKDNIRVSWKEVRCHQAWMGTYPDVWSEYALNVFVRGPRGIDPWTGKRLLSTIVPAAVQKAH